MSYKVFEQEGQIVGVVKDSANVQIVGGIPVNYQIYTGVVEKIDNVNDHYEVVDNGDDKKVVEK